MALITSFTGTSPSGDLTEAIEKALNKARPTEFKKKKDGRSLETSGDKLELGPISVKIQIDRAKARGGYRSPHGPQ